MALEVGGWIDTNFESHVIHHLKGYGLISGIKQFSMCYQQHTNFRHKKRIVAKIAVNMVW